MDLVGGEKKSGAARLKDAVAKIPISKRKKKTTGEKAANVVSDAVDTAAGAVKPKKPSIRDRMKKVKIPGIGGKPNCGLYEKIGRFGALCAAIGLLSLCVALIIESRRSKFKELRDIGIGRKVSVGLPPFRKTYKQTEEKKKELADYHEELKTHRDRAAWVGIALPAGSLLMIGVTSRGWKKGCSINW